MKKINTWFRCEYPGCPAETDIGYEVQYQGKKIRVCKECLKKIRRRGKGDVSEIVHA